MKQINVEYLPIDEIIPYSRNPRLNDEAVEYVANSIKEFGFKNPVIVDGDNVIIAGHTRIKAAKKLGLKEIPVIRADDLTEDQVKAFRIADNKVAEFAEWDFTMLDMELDDIQIDMESFGFESMEDIEIEDTEIIEDDPPEEVETKAEPGDVWKLGNHRLICGDSADPNVIEKLLDGAKGDLLLTDPPYGIKADKGFSDTGVHVAPRRHYTDDWDGETPEQGVFDYVCMLADNAIIFGGNYFTDKLPVGTHWLVWNKHNTMPSFSDAELAWTNIKRNSVKVYDVLWNGMTGKEKERFHPTQKPVKLFADIISDYTDQGGTVMDFFGGSGTTLIACEQTGRICYICEISPHYCDVIIERWEKLTGKKAELCS